MLILGLAFCATHLSTQVPSVTSKKCCHVGIMSYMSLRTWDPYEVVGPNFHALNG